MLAPFLVTFLTFLLTTSYATVPPCEIFIFQLPKIPGIKHFFLDESAQESLYHSHPVIWRHFTTYNHSTGAQPFGLIDQPFPYAQRRPAAQRLLREPVRARAGNATNHVRGPHAFALSERKHSSPWVRYQPLTQLLAFLSTPSYAPIAFLSTPSYAPIAFQGVSVLLVCDTLWVAHLLNCTRETRPAMRARVRTVLDSIAADAETTYVSITSHMGTSRRVLEILGLDSGLFGGKHAQVYPVVVQRVVDEGTWASEYGVEEPARSKWCPRGGGKMYKALSKKWIGFGGAGRMAWCAGMQSARAPGLTTGGNISGACQNEFEAKLHPLLLLENPSFKCSGPSKKSIQSKALALVKAIEVKRKHRQDHMHTGTERIGCHGSQRISFLARQKIKGVTAPRRELRENLAYHVDILAGFQLFSTIIYRQKFMFLLSIHFPGHLGFRRPSTQEIYSLHETQPDRLNYVTHEQGGFCPTWGYGGYGSNGAKPR
ncbi:hypothetical protein BU23DRAFT_602801 [Bimuria novae-zelandiae CBS 107.79]|uniref:Uncharacterized protein n=1 Tax=Bimuria novae-zelandiae CBS 107.79 TaxID=1447943 RepID=A0A6A5UXN0_9PLEO|nr:hypothetical protein BU23DRAFT_602801 [Bimuria novae-zelandiae CBS 107.79]